MKNFIQKCANYLGLYLELQLFLTACSLPILVGWGLPLSLICPIANLLFSPFLIIFLLCSTIIFFLEILRLPNQLFIFLLEKITYCWELLLNWASIWYLCSLPQQSLLLISFLPGVAYCIIRAKNMRLSYRIFLLSIVLLIPCLSRSLFVITDTCYIGQQKHHIHCIKNNDLLICYDNGCLSLSKNPESFVQYTVLTELNKHFGANTIDYFI